MSSVLTQVEWGKPALQLLNHLTDLDPEKPAILHLRHTEREKIKKKMDKLDAQSTPIGLDAAFEFGSGLPKNRKIRLYHTEFKRTEETASSMLNGAKGNQVDISLEGVIPVSTIVNQEEYTRLRKTENNVIVPELIFKWVADLVPANIMFSPLEFAKDMARHNMSNLINSPKNILDVYITHDVWIASIMFHWFAIPPYSDCIKYLDGFIIQPADNGIDIWYREHKYRVEYPYWWEY